MKRLLQLRPDQFEPLERPVLEPTREDMVEVKARNGSLWGRPKCGPWCLGERGHICQTPQLLEWDPEPEEERVPLARPLNRAERRMLAAESRRK